MLRRRLIGLLLALGLATTSLLAPPAVAAPLAIPLAAPSAPKGAPRLDTELVATRLGALSQKNLDSTAWAVYTSSGKAVLVNDKLMVPASTTKILTALAAIDVLGAKKTFTTKVVSAKKGRIILVAGGDPYLTSGKSTVPAKKANLTDLAAATAKALKKTGVKKVTLTYSAPLFSGPSYSPSWKTSWASYTPRIMSLTVNGGKSGSSAYSDPGLSTAKLFASKLKAKGIEVTFARTGSVPKGAKTIAAVTSAPLGTMIRRMLRYSDNVAAETFARHVAIKVGKAPSFDGGSAAITAWLKGKSLWGKGMKIDGGSGLSSKTKVLPSVLAQSVGFALADPKYVDVVKGLPVAGVDGTLKNRFNDPSEKAGRTIVHAKTGSLKQVNALAGYLTTGDGQVLTFAFLATHNGNYGTTAGNWLDRSATALVTCGCSLIAA
ncbi:MAG: D-alanyl-D-alanine carboxypeptidase/D-alanyl-D-alanine-endopeptidase [Propionibacteriaceae bacterium]|nr:D-alanyl-D-alanine carboxypeptidase/D-alanyl-D-alanine-endopeptidase [Propionibacteriaceae bacterium]